MLNSLFKGIFDTNTSSNIDVYKFLLCLIFSLILGAIITLCCAYRTKSSKSFIVTIALLPSIVCVVIMLVNGNIGAGVAVAGAFSLVRFRSLAGKASEICTLFFAMGAGLVSGMGYLGFSLVFTLILCALFMLYNRFDLGADKNSSKYKTIRIVIPEDLDYTGVFDDIFNCYLSSFDLTNVKTTNMGSLYKLTYDVVLKDPLKEKEMIDKLRCRNGNLEINVSKTVTSGSEL